MALYGASDIEATMRRVSHPLAQRQGVPRFRASAFHIDPVSLVGAARVLNLQQCIGALGNLRTGNARMPGIRPPFQAQRSIDILVRGPALLSIAGVYRGRDVGEMGGIPHPHFIVVAVRADGSIKIKPLSIDAPHEANQPLCASSELFYCRFLHPETAQVLKKPEWHHANPPGLRGIIGLSGNVRLPGTTAGAR